MIIELIKNTKNYGALLSMLKSKNMLTEIVTLTSYLDINYVDISWAQRLWHIKRDNHKLITCHNPKCSNLAIFDTKHSDRGYKCCSRICSHKLKDLTIMMQYGVDNISRSDISRSNSINTNILKYGVINYSKTTEFKQKFTETSVERYGVEHPMYSEKIKIKQKLGRISNGSQIPDHKLSEFKKYKKIVRNETYKHKKALWSLWDGHDYYDGEYIRDNRALPYTNKKYPTIDHKTPILIGFQKNISPYDIGNIVNLCITKGGINGKKKFLTEDQFVSHQTVNNLT